MTRSPRHSIARWVWGKHIAASLLGVRALLRRLERAYGAQHWWPADSAFEIVIGAVLVQRTTWANAEAAIGRLRRRDLLHCEALASAELPVLESCVRTAGFYRSKAARLRAIARYFRDLGGVGALLTLRTPALQESLLKLPGIGRETADAIALYAYDRPVWVVDAYSQRVLGRMSGRSWKRHDELAYVAPLVRARAVGALKELHALLVEHGKQRCKSRPLCADCVLQRRCSYAADAQLSELTRRAPREPTPRARGPRARGLRDRTGFRGTS